MTGRVRRWVARALEMVSRSDRETDLEAELESHLVLHVDDNLRAGMSEEEARRAAMLALGGVEQTKELCRERRGLPFLEALAQDAAFSLRLLRKSPGLACVAILTLASSMGATSTLFSIVYDGVWRDRPGAPDSGAIVAYYPARNFYSYRFSVPELQDLRSQTRLFERVGAITGFAAAFTSGAYPEYVQCTRATPDQFDTAPLLGRLYGPDEDRPGGPPVAVITAELWKRAFDSDPQILGKTVRLDRVAYTIIGVLPEHSGLWGGSVMVPFQLDLADSHRQDRPFWVTVTLQRGVSRSTVSAGLDALAERWEHDYGKSVPEYAGLRLVYRNGAEWMRSGIMPSIYVLAGAVGLVLLIAGVNVATLLLSRVSARSREVAVRLALGASRGRIVRQVLTESVVLALCGGALGVVASVWGVPLAVSVVPYDYLYWPQRIRLEPQAVLACLGLCIALGAALGLPPALHLSRVRAGRFVRDSAARAGTDRKGRSSRRALVVVETVLLLRSYDLLMKMDLGFQPRSLLSASLQLPEARYSSGREMLAFYRELLARLASLPGVSGAGLTSAQPIVDRIVDRAREDFSVIGKAPADPLATPSALVEMVSPDYFDVMGTRVLRGRAFAEDDDAERPRVALVNEAMVRDYWPGGDALGATIRLGSSNPSDAGSRGPVTIVGVVADARQVRVIESPVLPELYVPIAQRPDRIRHLTLLVRSPLDAASLTGALRAAVAGVDREQPLGNVETMDQAVTDAFGPKRLTTALLSVFAGLAVFLVVACFYATLAYSVAQRTHEIGVRAALGASPRQILDGVLGEGLRLAATGVVLGVSLTLALTRTLRGLLYGVSPHDPVTLGASAVALLAVAMLACLVPARRAMRLDPVAALRQG